MTIKEEQTLLNEQLAQKLKRYGISNLWLTSFGNSIASGHSMTRTIKPLLMRNETLAYKMAMHDVRYVRRAYTRCTNNSEEKLYEWLITNMTESEVNKFSHVYYGDGPTNMPNGYLDYSKFEEYYPTNIPDDIGLSDLVKTNDDNLANIIVYNGCAGSFLDNNCHDGKLNQRLFYSVNRDITSLEAILKYIQTMNRMNGARTQVYICGVPNSLGLNISKLINSKLKNVANEYANTIYVKPVKSKHFYKSLRTGKIELDVHYDEEEYDRLNNNIIKTIKDNYVLTDNMIKSDRDFYDFGNCIEFSEAELRHNSEAIIERIDSIISNIDKSITGNQHKLSYYKRLLDYLIERCPYDYHLLEQKNIKKVIKNKIKTNKKAHI